MSKIVDWFLRVKTIPKLLVIGGLGFVTFSLAPMWAFLNHAFDWTITVPTMDYRVLGVGIFLLILGACIHLNDLTHVLR